MNRTTKLTTIMAAVVFATGCGSTSSTPSSLPGGKADAEEQTTPLDRVRQDLAQRGLLSADHVAGFDRPLIHHLKYETGYLSDFALDDRAIGQTSEAFAHDGGASLGEMIEAHEKEQAEGSGRGLSSTLNGVDIKGCGFTVLTTQLRQLGAEYGYASISEYSNDGRLLSRGLLSHDEDSYRKMLGTELEKDRYFVIDIPQDAFFGVIDIEPESCLIRVETKGVHELTNPNEKQLGWIFNGDIWLWGDDAAGVDDDVLTVRWDTRERYRGQHFAQLIAHARNDAWLAYMGGTAEFYPRWGYYGFTKACEHEGETDCYGVAGDPYREERWGLSPRPGSGAPLMQIVISFVGDPIDASTLGGAPY